MSDVPSVIDIKCIPRHSHINSEVYSDPINSTLKTVLMMVLMLIDHLVNGLMNGLCESMVWLCLGVTICLLFMWFRDSIREYTSTYEILIGMFFMAYCVLVLSESLFFITFFWSSFHASCSSVWSQVGLYLSDPSELTSTNTVLLSNSGLSLGCAYLIRETHILRYSLYLLSFLLAFTFISLQVKEFRNITLYMNESIYSCVFFFHTSLHLFHVVVGILLIGLILWTSCYSRSVLNFVLFQLRVTPHHLFYTLQLIYWHFVEILWLFIYYVLYN
jgi:cytochrome c oxidase subunit 3